jgi:hypothetical protein
MAPVPGPNRQPSYPGSTGTGQMAPVPGPYGPQYSGPGAGPRPPGLSDYAPGAVVLDVGKVNGRKAIVGAVVAGVVGLVAIVAGLAGAVDGGAGVGIAVTVVGVLFLIPVVLVVAGRNKLFRPRRLVFEPGGIRWDDPAGAPWAIPWRELAAVSVNKHSAREVGPQSVSDAIVGAATEKIAGERALVRLDMFPADPTFHGRHPELAHLWQQQGGYRLPLGGNVAFIPAIAQAMGRFAPRIYRGVNATQGFMGLR